MNVKTVTMDVKKLENLQFFLQQNRTGKPAAEKWHKQLIQLQKSGDKVIKGWRRNKMWTTYINDMRAVINILAPTLGEEGTKTFEDLKRQIYLMEEKNTKQLNEKKYFKKHSPSPSNIGNILRRCLKYQLRIKNR